MRIVTEKPFVKRMVLDTELERGRRLPYLVSRNDRLGEGRGPWQTRPNAAPVASVRLALRLTLDTTPALLRSLLPFLILVFSARRYYYSLFGPSYLTLIHDRWQQIEDGQLRCTDGTEQRADSANVA